MTNFLESGCEWLAETLAEHAGTTVTYKRSSTTLTGISAVVGSTRTESQSADGTLIDVRHRDYLIAATDINFGAGAIEPAEGDEIRETIGGVVHVFTVLPLAGEDAFRWSDPYRNTYRIHAKLTGTE